MKLDLTRMPSSAASASSWLIRWAALVDDVYCVRRAVPKLVEKLRVSVKAIRMVWSDSHFDTAILHAWIRRGWAGEAVRNLRKRLGFAVLPRRWVVEQTFVWWYRYRRQSKDYERTESSSKAFIYIAMIRLIVKRIRHDERDFFNTLLMIKEFSVMRCFLILTIVFSCSCSKKTNPATIVVNTIAENNTDEKSRIEQSIVWKYSIKASTFFSRNQDLEFCIAIQDNDLARVKELHIKGQDISIRGEHGITPLVWAFFSNSRDCFQYLLLNRADPHIFFTDSMGIKGISDGRSLIHVVSLHDNPLYLEDLFVYSNFDANIKTKGKWELGKTPMNFIFDGFDISNKHFRYCLLRKAGAIFLPTCSQFPGQSEFLVDAFFSDPLLCRCMLIDGCDPFNFRLFQDTTILHEVARYFDKGINRSKYNDSIAYDIILLLELMGDSFDDAQEEYVLRKTSPDHARAKWQSRFIDIIISR